jgi:hypothetical protein
MAKVTAGTSLGAHGDALGRAMDDVIAGRPTYPSGTTFIRSDLDGFGKRLAEDAREGKPIVIEYPDGEERYLVPSPHPSATVSRLGRLRLRWRDARR